MTIDTAWKIIVAIFLGGIFFARMIRMGRDMNGLGARVKRESERNDFRFIITMVSELIHTQDESQREKAGQRFLNAWQGRR